MPICYSYRIFIICNTHINIFVWYMRNMFHFYCSLVFTKSVNSTFRAFWLAPATRKILGYSLFCDRSQDGVSLRGIIGSRNLTDKWSSLYKQIPRKGLSLACRCLLVGRKLFSCWICDKIVKMHCTLYFFSFLFDWFGKY